MALPVSFCGKRVLVTGGGRGLGKSIVKKLCEDGAVVFTVDRDDNFIQDLKKEFPQVTAVTVDVSDFDNVRKIVESFAPLDHLVNNAGIMIQRDFMDITTDDLNQILDVNFKSMVVIGQAAAKGMIANGTGGSIVNISSITTRQVLPKLTVYSCSKAAVSALTRHMAVELGQHNIRVNAISPTLMDTPFGLDGCPEAVEATLAKHVIKRILQPKEAADLVLFLLSPLSAMITGDDILIDAGFCSH